MINTTTIHIMVRVPNDDEHSMSIVNMIRHLETHVMHDVMAYMEKNYSSPCITSIEIDDRYFTWHLGGRMCKFTVRVRFTTPSIMAEFAREGTR